MREPTDFGDRDYPVAMVNVTNVCNLSCSHCFIRAYPVDADTRYI